jgi:hygromycin-B 7''-O-kinase
MKLFVTDIPEMPWERERRALALTADYAGVPVPRLVGHGQVPAPRPVPFLLMTRLPGMRWADRRPHLTNEESASVHRRVGSLLRQFHRQSDDRTAQSFGSLTNWDLAWPSLADAVDDRLGTLVRRYRKLGGSDLLRGTSSDL